MNIRQLTGLELQQARYIWSQSFERGDRAMEDWIEWEERTPEGRATYGIFDSAGLQAAFLLVDEEIHLGPDVVLPMSAVCGVGVLPASRGRGYATSGMRQVFERMRDQGQPISFLEPFNWDFYARLGYAWTASTREYSVPTQAMKPCPETKLVRAARPEDRPAVIACYTRLARRYRGMLVRRPQLWDWRFDASKKATTYTYVYDRDGTIEGYISFHGGKREETRIDEFITDNPRALRGLLGLLRRHEMQTDKFVWDAPPDDPFWSTLVHTGLQTRLHSKTMARIVDVAAALQALQPPANILSAFTLAVVDETARWNQATWRVECEEGNVTAAATEERPQVTLSIQALAQAYLGTPTVAQLREAGLIEVHDEPGFKALATLLAGSPTWCNDGF